MSLHIGGRGVRVCGGETAAREKGGVWNNLALVADCSGVSVGLRGYLLWNLLDGEQSEVWGGARLSLIVNV